MLSGQLVPTTTTSANNFVGQSEYFVDDDHSSYNVEFNNKNSKQEKEEQNFITATTTILSEATANSATLSTQGLLSNNNECQQQTELLDIKKNILNAPSFFTTTTISNSKVKQFSGGGNGSSSSSITSFGNIDLYKELDSGYNNVTISSSNSPPSPPKLSLASSSFPFNSINYLTSGSNNISTGYKNNDISKNLNTNLLSSLSAVPLAIVTNINNNLTNNNNNNYNNNSNNYNTNNNNNNNDTINNNNNNNNNGNNHLNDATGRSAALERAYVHDVYANCEETTGSIRPRVAQFLAGLEPGSIVCDVGCGNGRYLTACNPFICTIGVDRCYRLTKVAKEKGGEVALCDNLELPFRDESFDAVLSLAVVHHFATTERRVGAIRELARILRIGGRVIISVWALEQRHRRFESQDVLIPWQPPKNRTINYSDEEDEDDYLPPYHAYTEDSTNSSRSAGDGDSSSLSSSSPGESCYSFVRRAIQKLAGRRKHPWFLDSWTSKDTKNNSSLDYEDAKDLPIELRRLEDFEDFPDPPLSAGLKSRSLGSILNPPPRQIVRSRSSVPSLGSCAIHPQQQQQSQQQIFFPEHKAQIKSHNQHHLDYSNASLTASQPHLNRSSINHTTNSQSPQKLSSQIIDGNSIINGSTNQLNISPTNNIGKGPVGNSIINNSNNGQTTITTSGSSSTTNVGRRPKLIKQKQSLCDEEYQLPDNPFHMISNNNNSNNNISNSNNNLNNSSHNLSSNSSSNNTFINTVKIFQKQNSDSKLLLRKQSSLNEELMAENRLREKERVRKRIQKQMSLNEAFLCRSVFTKRLQIIREGFTTKLKTSTGSLERVTKNSLVKIMKNFQTSQFASQNVNNTNTTTTNTGISSSGSTCNNSNCTAAGGVNCNLSGQQQNQQLNPLNGKCSISRKNSCQTLVNAKLAMQHCITAGTHSTSGGICSNCNNGSGGSGSGGSSNSSNNSNDDPAKPRRHSRESGSDSSKDSSLQSDTSIESEDSFASVIFIPKIENLQEQQQHQCNHQQQQQQLYHQHQKHSSSTNSSSSNGGATSKTCNCLHFHQNGICNNNGTKHYHQHNNNKSQYILPPVPTSPLIMPCPPTPAHSPAAQNCGSSTVTSPPLQIVSGMLLSPPNLNLTTGGNNINNLQTNNTSAITAQVATMMNKIQGKKSNDQNHFTFDDDHIKQQQINIPSSSLLLSKDEESLDKLNIKITSSSSENLNIKQQKSIQKKISPKITRQTIKDLPPIPKFRKQQSLHNSNNNKTLNNFPIIRRSSAVPTTVTKLISLELFNPETDDLDSDSSEPSSPDSIDSVINTKPLSSSSSVEKDNNKLVLTDKNDDINDDIKKSSNITKLQQTKEYHSLDLPNLPKINNNYDDELVNNKNCSIINNSNQDDLFKKYSNNKDNLIVNSSDLITNKKLLSTTMKNNDSKKKSLNNKNPPSNNSVTSRQEFVDFAEQLSAQLLKSIDKSNRKYDIQYIDDDKLECDNDCITTKFTNNIDEFIDDPYTKNHHNNDDIHNLTDWREELRERRLNLANLSTQPSLQQSPISSSTSSLSSQTRSFTIHEEDEEEDDGIIAESSAVSYSLSNYYDNRCKNLKYKYRGNFPLDYRNYNINPETAYLIQDDVDSHDDDEDDIIEHDNIILEEDEDDEENELNDKNNDKIINKNNGYGKRTSRNTIRCQDDSIESPSLTNEENIGIASGSGCSGSVALSQINNTTTETQQQQQQPIVQQSGESWALTNSSNSLDSPSQSGGSTTHHRYYHVFREGELDALINHHVTSLHIVSSYYERASWCVVAEKVQVWTI